MLPIAPRGYLLERYCFRQTAIAFVLAVGVVDSLLLINFALQVVRQGMVLRGSGDALLLPAALTLLSTSSLVLPAALLVATIQVVSRMRADGEFIAIQAAGGSWRHVAQVLLLAGAGVTGLALVATHVVEPRARRALTHALRSVAGRMFVEGGEPVRLDSSSVAQVLEGTHGDRHLVISTRDPSGTDAFTVASPDHVTFDPLHAQMNLELNHVITIEVGAEDAYRFTTAERVRAALPVQVGRAESATELSDGALLQRIAEKRRQGLRHGRDRLELGKRTSFPFACLAFSLLGIPLGYARSRGDKAYGYLVSAGVILGYYLVVRAADALADPHPFAARVLLWSPNLAAFLAGLAWLERQHGRPP